MKGKATVFNQCMMLIKPLFISANNQKAAYVTARPMLSYVLSTSGTRGI
jgi:hypothetical protein